MRSPRTIIAALCMGVSLTALAATAKYVASKNSDVYHRPECRVVAGMKVGNLEGYLTKAEARAAGKRPCEICKP